ncbi:MAG: endonuclease [Bacteroidota bacterium]
MKKLCFTILAFVPFIAIAQPPGYYNTAEGLNGQDLRLALRNIIRAHVSLSYTPGVWSAYNTTDRKANGKIWDIYSDIPGGTPAYEYDYSVDQCGSSTPGAENGCYNREHTWPQSMWTFPTDTPMKVDLFHVYPADNYVNARRDNWPYGKVVAPAQTFTNGSKLGPNTYPGSPATTSFEPIDSFKGDIARTYFYVSTCYRNDSTRFVTWEMATLVALKPWAAAMLLEWHHLDPVSKKEKDRNNAIYALQNNRNPFIDRPEFADCIWGTANCNPAAIATTATEDGIQTFPNPAKGQVNITWQYGANAPQAIRVFNLAGQVVYVAESLAGDHTAVNITTWPAGIYYIQAITTRGVQVQKLVVE